MSTLNKISTLAGSTVFVTGGAGFIGSHIVDRLLSSGCKVVVVDDLSTGKEENINPKAIFYNGSIEDMYVLKEIFKVHNIDYVIHQAAKINLNVMLEDTAKDVNNSVLGTLNLLKCSYEYNIKKFIYASSVAVYGRPVNLPVAEDDKLDPIYSYGIAKKCAEEYVRYYSRYYDLNYSILRYANVYGPRQPVYGEVGVIAIYTKKALKRKPLIIYGDGTQLRDYIYIDDVVEITLRTLMSGDRETFNVGCGVGVSVNEVFEIFVSASESKPKQIHKPERTGELGRLYCNTEKLLLEINYIPKITLDKGIKRVLYYYRKFNEDI